VKPPDAETPRAFPSARSKAARSCLVNAALTGRTPYQVGHLRIRTHRNRARTVINYETSIVAPASAKISFRRASMFVMDNDQQQVVWHRELLPSESRCHRGQSLDRLKSGYPTGRPHLRPRRIRRKQLHFREYCCAMFCARASSPYGTRLSHALVFGLPIAARWARKFWSDRGGERLFASIARIQ
jgi:hypothetical protein